MNRQTSLKPSGPWEVRRRIKLQSMGHPANALAVECALAELPGVVKAFADAVKGRAGLMQSHRQQMFTSGSGNSDQRLNFYQQGLEQMQQVSAAHQELFFHVVMRDSLKNQSHRFLQLSYARRNPIRGFPLTG